MSRSVDKVTLCLEKFPLDMLCDVVGFFDHMNVLECESIKDSLQVCTGQCLYDNFRSFTHTLETQGLPLHALCSIHCYCIPIVYFINLCALFIIAS